MNDLIKISGFCFIIISAILNSCKKDEEAPALIITTDPISQIARTSAWCRGTILSVGPDSIIGNGFCWSTEILPTFEDDKIIAPQYLVDSIYQCRITGLNPGTTYYVRAYGITCASKIYGNQVSFTTKPATVLTYFNPDLTYHAVSDIEGNSYKTIQIGTQEWMAENLKTTKFNDGTSIPLITHDIVWSGLTTPGYCWYENNEEIFKNIYGAYYNWYAVNKGNLCPTGWHVPSEEEWKVFKMFLGMTQEQAELLYAGGTTEGNKIKETGTFNWVEGSIGATNESGFTGLPGGTRSVGPATFCWEGLSGGWWSAMAYNPEPYSPAWSHHVVWDASWIFRSDMLVKPYGLNVRCIKD